MQSPNAVIRFKLYNLLNSNFFSNQEKSLLIVFSYICNRIETTLSKTYLEKKEALCLSCKSKRRKFSDVVQGRHSGSHAIAWAAIGTSVCIGFPRASD